MEQSRQSSKQTHLVCESRPVFLLLMTAAGFMGAYTYVLKGGVFCNAQTGNLLKLSIALGEGAWGEAAGFLVPLAAYVLGAIASEALPVPVRKMQFLRWDTLLLGFEIAVLVALGFLPDTAPVQISQIAINFLCSMQYNTFRQAQGIPMATTFCTNHVRQLGIWLVYAVRKKDATAWRRCARHVEMLAAFVAGAAVGTALCGWAGNRAVWGAALLLALPFGALAWADRTHEKGKLHQTPAGH